MGNRGLTEKDIFNTCYILEKQNVKPTAKNLREHIGSGSMTTISKHLKNWPRYRASYINEISSPDLKQLLTGVDDKILCEYFQNELPQMTALVLSHLNPARAASILELMDTTTKLNIIQRIEKMAPVRSEITELIAIALQSEIQSLIVIKDHTLGGKTFADSIKKQMAI